METKDGFLVINKDKGCTSHDCVKQIRKLLNTKKVGHTGTLDPEVIGILPIAIGSATREIINQKSWPKISDEKLDQYLNRFRGIIKQIPPKVSSVHVNGERAYKKSFRNEVFELAPREVKIDELTLMKWDQINGIIEIKVKCSAGTYIRAIARDLGEILNSEGCLLQLKRISACGFDEQNSIKISDIEKDKKNSKNFIIPTISALNHISSFVLSTEEQINFWQTGRAIRVDINYFQENKSFDYKKPIKVIDKKQILLGIGFLNEEQSNINPKLVLNAK